MTHFFQSGEGCDAERTNLVSGMKWKKLNKGQETMGMSWKMQHDVWRISVSRQIYLGLYTLVLLFIQVPNIIRKRGLDVM